MSIPRTGDGPGIKALNRRLPGENTIVLAGDSIAALDNIDTTSLAGFSKLPARGVFAWTNYLLNQRFRVVNRAGVSGNKTSDLLARLGTDVIAYRPKYCWLIIGANDVTNDIAAATTILNFQAIFSQLIAANIVPIVNLVPPSTSISTNARAAAWVTVNQFIRDYARGMNGTVGGKVGGIIVLDTEWVYLDTANTYPQPLAGYTDGVVHPYTKGSYAWAKQAASILDPIIPKVPIFDSASKPTYSTGDAALIANPTMLGTGGTKNTGVTGSLADSWTATIMNSFGTAVASKVARTDGPGSWQQVAFTGSASFAGVDTGCQLTSSTISLPAGVAIGDTVACFVEYQMDASPTLYLGTEVRMRFNGATAPQWVTAPAWETSAEYVPLAQDQAGGFIATGETVIPAGTTGISVFIRPYASAANAAFTYRIGRVQVRKLQSYG